MSCAAVIAPVAAPVAATGIRDAARDMDDQRCGHYRHCRVSVIQAAHRTASLDEQGVCDDWVMQGMKFFRREALKAGHTLDEINDWTMDGCVAGRQYARENHFGDDDE